MKPPKYGNSVSASPSGPAYAIAGFSLSLIGALFGLVPLLPLILDITGLTFSMLGLKSAKRGLAIFGIIIAIIAIIWNVFYVVTLIFFCKGLSPLISNARRPSKRSANEAKSIGPTTTRIFKSMFFTLFPRMG